MEVLKQQLAHAQKLTALGELVSTTTHEFNNILMTIINYAKLGMRHRDNATREKAFEKILVASNRAAKITNTVLGIARNRGSEHEPTNLTSLVEDTLILLEREMNKYHVRIDKQFRPIPEAMVNANQIQQVLLNLLINARQAMPNGGPLVLKLSHCPDDGMIELVVRDYGSGIPADKLPRIFEPFYSTKAGPDASGKGGTGLGLSMCRDIIEAPSRPDPRRQHGREGDSLHVAAALRPEGDPLIGPHGSAAHPILGHTGSTNGGGIGVTGSAHRLVTPCREAVGGSREVGVKMTVLECGDSSPLFLTLQHHYREKGSRQGAKTQSGQPCQPENSKGSA